MLSSGELHDRNTAVGLTASNGHDLKDLLLEARLSEASPREQSWSFLLSRMMDPDEHRRRLSSFEG